MRRAPSGPRAIRASSASIGLAIALSAHLRPATRPWRESLRSSPGCSPSAGLEELGRPPINHTRHLSRNSHGEGHLHKSIIHRSAVILPMKGLGQSTLEKRADKIDLTAYVLSAAFFHRMTQMRTRKGVIILRPRAVFISCAVFVASTIWAASHSQADPAKPGHAGKSTEADIKTLPVDGFLAIELPSVWERPSSLGDLIGTGTPVQCIDFPIRATGTAPSEVKVTTSGMGGATLLYLTPTHESCSKSALAGLPILSIPKPGNELHWLRLIVPQHSFPELSEGATGELDFIVSDRPPLEVGVRLRRQGFPATFEVPLWFLGFGVPVLVSAWIGFAFTRWQKRLDTKQEYDGDLAALSKFSI